MGNQTQPNEPNDHEPQDEPIGQSQKGNPAQKGQPRDEGQQLREEQGLGRQQAPHIRDQIDRNSEQKPVNLG